MTRKILLTTVGLVLAGAGNVNAQVQVDLIPYAGAYVPAGNLADFTVTLTPGPGTAALKAKHKTAFLFGGRVDVWLSPAFGVEGNFAYALSDGELEAAEPGGTFTDLCAEDPQSCNATVWLGSVKGLYRVFVNDQWSIHFAGGGALIGRGGDFYEEASETLDFGGVLGVGATVEVSPQIGIAIDVEDYIYSYSATIESTDIGTVETGSKLQNDLILTAGLVIHLGS
jgi:hypothetical protein